MTGQNMALDGERPGLEFGVPTHFPAESGDLNPSLETDLKAID